MLGSSEGWWVERGAERGRTLGRRGQSLQLDTLKGLYMGRHVGCFFFLFYCFEQKKGGLLVRHGFCS